MKKLPYFIILLPLATHAETFQAPQPVFFEKEYRAENGRSTDKNAGKIYRTFSADDI